MENTRGILPARMHMRERAVFAVTFLRDFSADFFDAADAANVRNAPRVPSVAPVASVSTANRARTDTALSLMQGLSNPRSNPGSQSENEDLLRKICIIISRQQDSVSNQESDNAT